MEEVLYPQGQHGQGGDACQIKNEDGFVAEMSTEETPAVDGSATAPIFTSKHPTMYLNELRKDLKYDLLGESQEGINKQYTVGVVVDGEHFQATAKSKKLAKQEASKFALLKMFNILYIPEDKMTPEMMQSSVEGGKKNKRKAPNLPGVQGQKKKRKLVPRNALMVLNEFRTDLQFTVLSSTGPVHAPNFVVSVDVDGVSYEGCGSSKKAARQAAAEKALQAFPEKYSQFLEEQRMIETETYSAADSTTPCTSTSVSLAEISNKHPCVALNELRPGIVYTVISEQGLPHERQYVMSVDIDGETIQGSGRSKKDAKQHVAAAALAKLCKQ